MCAVRQKRQQQRRRRASASVKFVVISRRSPGRAAVVTCSNNCSFVNVCTGANQASSSSSSRSLRVGGRKEASSSSRPNSLMRMRSVVCCRARARVCGQQFAQSIKTIIIARNHWQTTIILIIEATVAQHPHTTHQIGPVNTRPN